MRPPAQVAWAAGVTSILWLRGTLSGGGGWIVSRFGPQSPHLGLSDFTTDLPSSAFRPTGMVVPRRCAADLLSVAAFKLKWRFVFGGNT
jgi:hypothetical protein